MSMRYLFALCCAATLLFSCNERSGTTAPTDSGDNPKGPSPQSTFADPIDYALFDALSPQFEAFTLQFYDDATGDPLDLVWIQDPLIVADFLGGIDMSIPPEEQIGHDLMQTAYVRTMNGEIYRFYVADIVENEAGLAVFHDGVVTTSPSLHTTIASAYGLIGYESSKEKEKEKTSPWQEAESFSEETLIADPPKAGPWTDITLIVYQDDPGKVFMKNNANRLAQAANSQAFGVNGLNSLVNEMRRLKAQCKRVKTLIMLVHGSPGSFRLGPKGAPFNGPSRVGGGGNQTSPQAFGQAIKQYLAPNATIKLGSCKTAKGQKGQNFIQAVADASCATVQATDKNTKFKSDGTPVKTAGNVYTATPNQPPPVNNGPPPGGTFPG